MSFPHQKYKSNSFIKLKNKSFCTKHSEPTNKPLLKTTKKHTLLSHTKLYHSTNTVQNSQTICLRSLSY